MICGKNNFCSENKRKSLISDRIIRNGRLLKIFNFGQISSFQTNKQTIIELFSLFMMTSSKEFKTYFYLIANIVCFCFKSIKIYVYLVQNGNDHITMKNVSRARCFLSRVKTNKLHIYINYYLITAY